MNRIIACGSIEPELEKLREQGDDIEIEYLPQYMHRSPETLNIHLQEAIDKSAGGEEKLILGFGLCSNAVVGLKAPQQGLIIPRVHDCIAFFLGSRELYHQMFRNHPGTYYLTASWLENQKDPLGLVEGEYAERVGREMAEEVMETEIRNYSRISYIHTVAGRQEHLRRAQENAEYFQKALVEHQVNNEYFRKILYGPHEEPDFVFVKPGETVKQREFFK